MSRVDSTIDDWIGSDDGEDDPVEGQDTLRGDCWEPEEPQCECGVSLTEWHSPGDARRMVRIYGSVDDGTVPACPACVDWTNASHRQHTESIPHAIKEMDAQSTVERRPRRALAMKEAMRDE